MSIIINIDVMLAKRKMSVTNFQNALELQWPISQSKKMVRQKLFGFQHLKPFVKL